MAFHAVGSPEIKCTFHQKTFLTNAAMLRNKITNQVYYREQEVINANVGTPTRTNELSVSLAPRHERYLGLGDQYRATVWENGSHLEV